MVQLLGSKARARQEIFSVAMQSVHRLFPKLDLRKAHLLKHLFQMFAFITPKSEVKAVRPFLLEFVTLFFCQIFFYEHFDKGELKALITISPDGEAGIRIVLQNSESFQKHIPRVVDQLQRQVGYICIKDPISEWQKLIVRPTAIHELAEVPLLTYYVFQVAFVLELGIIIRQRQIVCVYVHEILVAFDKLIIKILTFIFGFHYLHHLR